MHQTVHASPDSVRHRPCIGHACDHHSLSFVINVLRVVGHFGTCTFGAPLQSTRLAVRAIGIGPNSFSVTKSLCERLISAEATSNKPKSNKLEFNGCWLFVCEAHLAIRKSHQP